MEDFGDDDVASNPLSSQMMRMSVVDWKQNDTCTQSQVAVNPSFVLTTVMNWWNGIWIIEQRPDLCRLHPFAVPCSTFFSPISSSNLDYRQFGGVGILGFIARNGGESGSRRSWRDGDGAPSITLADCHHRWEEDGCYATLCIFPEMEFTGSLHFVQKTRCSLIHCVLGYLHCLTHVFGMCIQLRLSAGYPSLKTLFQIFHCRIGRSMWWELAVVCSSVLNSSMCRWFGSMSFRRNLSWL